MPSFEITADTFVRSYITNSPIGSSNTLKTHKNISLYFKFPTTECSNSSDSCKFLVFGNLNFFVLGLKS